MVAVEVEAVAVHLLVVLLQPVAAAAAEEALAEPQPEPLESVR